jgi:hypothetical protein
MDQNKIKAAHEELKALRKPIHNVNTKHKESLSQLEQIAVKVTDHVGSVGFFLVIYLPGLYYGWAGTRLHRMIYDSIPFRLLFCGFLFRT